MAEQWCNNINITLAGIVGAPTTCFWHEVLLSSLIGVARSSCIVLFLSWCASIHGNHFPGLVLLCDLVKKKVAFLKLLRPILFLPCVLRFPEKESPVRWIIGFDEYKLLTLT